MNIKATLRFHHRMTRIRTTTDNKCWKEFGGVGAPHSLSMGFQTSPWSCKPMQPPGNQCGEFLQS